MSKTGNVGVPSREKPYYIHGGSGKVFEKSIEEVIMLYVKTHRPEIGSRFYVHRVDFDGRYKFRNPVVYEGVIGMGGRLVVQTEE